MRLKDADKKFSGDLEECWMEFVDDYLQILKDFGLTNEQRKQFMHNLLSKDAKRYYLERVDPYAQTFQQAVGMINQEYNSIVRQTRVNNFLNSLRLSDFLAKGIEMSDALAKIYKLITKLSRQVPTLCRGDAHKIDFLGNATVRLQRSHEPRSLVATYGLSFHLFNRITVSSRPHYSLTKKQRWLLHVTKHIRRFQILLRKFLPLVLLVRKDTVDYRTQENKNSRTETAACRKSYLRLDVLIAASRI